MEKETNNWVLWKNGIQKFQPDVIVVNLGTNASSGTKNMDRIGKAVEDFLRKLRVCNPESLFCGVMECLR